MKFYDSGLERYANVAISKRTIGVSMSVGISSTMLCYLLARTAVLQNIDVSIVPMHISITGGLPTKQRFETMIPLISEITGFTGFSKPWNIELMARAEQPALRDAAFKAIDSLFQRNSVVENMYLGSTVNPSIALHPNLADGRDLNRDTPIRNLNQLKSYPFADVDKGFIMDLYVQHGLMENLFPLTMSCNDPEAAIAPGKRGCGSCFSCREEAWAISTTSVGV